MDPKTIIYAVIGLVIGLVVSLSTLGTVVDLVDAVNVTDWDFTGYSGAIALLNLIPFVYIASILLLCVTASFAMANRGT